MNLLRDIEVSSITTRASIQDQALISTHAAGVSLFDVKNEIFLSYLQGLALRNLSIVRSIKNGQAFDQTKELSDRITKKLVEQRVYLEKGVRPLEQRIKYQIDKVVRAADDEQRTLQENGKLKDKTTSNRDQRNDDSEDGASESAEEIDDISYRPNPAAFNLDATAESNAAGGTRTQKDGVYRPPRVSAAVMPDVDQKEKRQRRPLKSRTIDEYIDNELSTAPMTEPSIGSTLAAGGRQNKSSRELADEAARQEYEETHLVRLPTMSKKEKAKQAKNRPGHDSEEMRGLGDSLSRISELTRRSKTNALGKSRKRRAVEDGPRDDGIGHAFDMRRKRVEKRMKR